MMTSENSWTVGRRDKSLPERDTSLTPHRQINGTRQSFRRETSSRAGGSCYGVSRMLRHNPERPETSDPTHAAGIAEVSLRRQSKLPPSGVDALLMWTRLGNAGEPLIADGCEKVLRQPGSSVSRSHWSIHDVSPFR